MSSGHLLSGTSCATVRGKMSATQGAILCVEPLRQFAAYLSNLLAATRFVANFAIDSAMKMLPRQRGGFELELPVSVRPMVHRLVDYQKIAGDQVPDIVANNPLWAQLSQLEKEVYMIYTTERQAVLMLQLQESGVQLVLKGVSKDRVAVISDQIQAEVGAAAALPWHPSIGTLQAACFDDEGNWCCVMPYVGCSLQSIIESADWSTCTTADDKLTVAKSVIAHSLVVYQIMQEAGHGFIFRDVKPSNVCIEPATGHVSVIDFGLTIKATLEDYFDGFTPGYFVPEIADLSVICNKNLRKQTMNLTTVVFLTSFMGLEVAVGLDNSPWQLRSSNYDLNTSKGVLGLLQAHAAAGKAGYADLISQISCPVAQDFFKETMCSDPQQRLTPAQALKHTWLVGYQEAIQETLAGVQQTRQQQRKYSTRLFRGVPGVQILQCG